MFQQPSTLVDAWSNAQRRLWKNWFGMLRGAALPTPLNRTPNPWQAGLELVAHSAQTALAAQEASQKAMLSAFRLTSDTLDTGALRDEVMNLSARAAASFDLPSTGFPAVGSSASLSRTISEADIVTFAYVSGDVNPVHLDEEYAKKTRFGGRIAHGMLAAGLISAVLGTKLPGPGAVYLSQDLQFTGPVQIGDEITATATVTEAKEGKPIYTIETVCTNQNGDTVVKGEAVILYDPVPEEMGSSN